MLRAPEYDVRNLAEGAIASLLKFENGVFLEEQELLAFSNSAVTVNKAKSVNCIFIMFIQKTTQLMVSPSLALWLLLMSSNSCVAIETFSVSPDREAYTLDNCNP